ncbi:MAG: hypothetical protein RR356_03230, partial [Bacteroidales bacterium]
IPQAILNWPAQGDFAHKGQSFYLAPFFDVDNDGIYNPENGDYPYYDISNELCPWTEANIDRAALPPGDPNGLPVPPEEPWSKINNPTNPTTGMIYADHVLKGDETLYWIFNDKGGPHTESGGAPIGLEIRGQAFAFSTNDELNNMTFYSYEIINRSTTELTNTYFSQWVDPDVGYADDDFVGCDVARGLGYCYNGKNIDGTGGVQHYGNQPPAVGVDFFQGPYMDPDGYDNPSHYGENYLGPSYSANFPDPCGIVKDHNTLKSFTYKLKNGDDTTAQFMVRAEAINGVNFGDGIVDNERFGMRRFVYHNRDNSPTGDPDVAAEYYNLLQGIWKDNSRMRYGKNAYKDKVPNAPECDFMFPGSTDPCNWGTNGIDPGAQYVDKPWTEENENNAPFDRRFMQSAGPFTLKAGAVNYITVGIPWARASQGGAWASVELLKIADDKCQTLFENCFKVIDGPTAPDVTIQELENELILYMSTDDPSLENNNLNETYEESDPQIPKEYQKEIRASISDTLYAYDVEGNPDTIVVVKDTVYYETIEYTDRTYKFEGFMIYQLSNKDVSVTDLDDADKAILIAQCDIENFRPNGTPIGQLVNWEYNEAIGTSVAVEKVNGSNAGIFHSLKITEDKFATGTSKLVNHKTYYFMVLAYAYNEFAPFSIDPNVQNGLNGQTTPFIAGRKNIKVTAGTPHSPTSQNMGTTLRSEYGTQPMITRIEGQGNGGLFLDMTDECRDAIVKNGYIDKIQYKNNHGPLAIKVIDPLRVQPFDYTIKFIENSKSNDVNDSTFWVLHISDEVSDAVLDSLGLTREIKSNMPISMTNEQLFLSLGISISIKNSGFKIYQDDVNKYVIEQQGGYTYKNLAKYAQVDYVGSTIEFANPDNEWLSGVADIDGDYPSNWIRSGQQASGAWQTAKDVQTGADNDYMKWRTEDYFIVTPPNALNTSGFRSRAFKDPEGQFEKVLNGLWGPYVLASCYDGGPQANYIVPDDVFFPPSENPEVSNIGPTPRYYDFAVLGEGAVKRPGFNMTMTNLYSVDIVFTADKSKWTRCMILEAGSTHEPSVDNAMAIRHEPKKMPSVGKDGKPDGTGTGMGWFPGYAINVETGERLHIMFSENSLDTANNGNDMIFNPTNVYAYYKTPDGESIEIGQPDYDAFRDIYGITFGEPVMGGKHYVYVMNSSGNTAPLYYVENLNRNRNFNDNNYTFTSLGVTYGGTFSDNGHNYPYYECDAYNPTTNNPSWLDAKFRTFTSIKELNTDRRKYMKMQLFNNVMWTAIPMPTYGNTIDWKNPSNLSDATIKIRVSRPYLRYDSRWYDNPSLSPNASQNAGYPMYEFTTKNIAPIFNDVSLYETVLQDINIVPNPYYGFSKYENTALETYVKIVNLPEECDISIYTVNGILIRTFKKSDKATTYVNWDLKNHAGIPVAGGVYIL